MEFLKISIFSYNNKDRIKFHKEENLNYIFNELKKLEIEDLKPNNPIVNFICKNYLINFKYINREHKELYKNKNYQYNCILIKKKKVY